MHSCNSSTGEAEVGNHEFEASLRSTVNPVSRNKNKRTIKNFLIAVLMGLNGFPG